MKKNVMMRIACFLLVAVLISTSTISGTYAKYVTEGTGVDTARVAKWGVAVDPNGDLFLKAYTDDDADYTGNSVESGNEWKVVAPGTTEDLDEIALTGTPEVATRVTYEATVNLDGWKLSNGDEYCPLIFTIEGETYGIVAHCGKAVSHPATTVAELAGLIKDALEACKKDYAPLTDLSTKNADYPSLTWAWPFFIDDAHDVKDTDLGNKAAADQYAVVQVIVKTTVTQID